MATATEGKYPLDPTTEVGIFRVELGDVVGVPHDPEDGLGDYQFVGDAAIEAWIAAYPDSPGMALSKGLASMATQMIVAAQDIQVDDIRIKTVERAKLMLEQSRLMGASAAANDVSGLFSVVPITLSGLSAGAPIDHPEVM